MVASRSARERKAAADAGPLARVRIDLDGQRQFLYKIACTTCTAKGDRPWSTHRPGDDNGFLAAMDRWTFHLTERHPGAEAPCLAYLEAAQQRLHERREARGSLTRCRGLVERTTAPAGGRGPSNVPGS